MPQPFRASTAQAAIGQTIFHLFQIMTTNFKSSSHSDRIHNDRNEERLGSFFEFDVPVKLLMLIDKFEQTTGVQLDEPLEQSAANDPPSNDR